MTAQSALIWTCVAVFIFTSIITLLGIIKRPRIIEIGDRWLKPLFSALILQVIGIGIIAFKIEVTPDDATAMKFEVYHTGANDTGIGIHFMCQERSQNLAARVCGAEFNVKSNERIHIHSGDACGYEYFVAS